MSSLNPAAKEFVPASSELVFTPIPDPDKGALSYPFSFIKGGDDDDWGCSYDVEDFAKGLLGEEKCDAGNFPDNIIEFYWLREGHNDEEPWELLCKLDNGNFALYTAWCDYTGFDCQGGMKLIVSKDLNRLFYEGMTEHQRAKYFKDKKEGYKPDTNVYKSDLARARSKVDNFKWDIPVVPVAKPAAEATRAFIRVWENGKELILNLDYVNGLEMEALEYAIRGLTAQFLTPKGAKVSKKKFYTANICCGASINGIDDYFKKRFGNPDKKWELRMKFDGTGIIRKWGKVEVSFILC